MAETIERKQEIKGFCYSENAELCNYIVLSEFDVDTGSTVRHQYPEKIEGVTEDWLAEHMLPEGAHNRDEDATYIFLNRNKRRLGEEWHVNPSLIAVPSQDQQTSSTDMFRYGFNVVHTKHHASIRRGATIQAICIFSSYQFVDCLKGPLNTALECYFNNPGEVSQEAFCYKC